MTYKKWLLLALVTGAGGVVAANSLGWPVPGLEWARVGGNAVTKTGSADATQGNVSGRRSAAGGGGGRRAGYEGPVPVVVSTSATADVPVYLRGVGAARALNTVTVKPQVDGKLIKVYFREGQDVKKGDLLAEIDPVTYQAALDQAVAKRNLTQSQLTNAQRDLDRYVAVGPNIATQKTIDTQRALVTQTTAQLKSDNAAIENTQAILNYTKLTSPLDGRTGQRLVDEGNLVRAGDAGIVTIAQIKPISVLFTLPQQQLAQVTAAMAKGPVQVEALDGDEKNVLDTGALTFIDNIIDVTTGTVKMKADLPNDRLQLWPGQFANVRVRVEVLHNAVTAPTAAVQRGPQGSFVYVLGGEGDKQMVTVRPVTVAQQDDKLAVFATGLAANEQVVTSGFARLKDQAAVTVVKPDEGRGNGNRRNSSDETAPDAAAPGAAQPGPSARAPGPETGSTEGVAQADAKPSDAARGERRGRRAKAESAVQ